MRIAVGSDHRGFESKEQIRAIILEFWDVFAEEGVRNPIRGAYFHVDTGEVTPVCVKPPISAKFLDLALFFSTTP